jgi:type I restriction enzyme S subunit
MEWKKVKLTEISKPKQWKNLAISKLSSEGYPVYGANGIIGRFNEYNHEFPTLAITCRGATCGTINITEAKSYITSNAMALDDVSEEVDQKFLYYALKKRGFKDVITGAAQPQITREGLSKIVLDIPESKEYQLHIANLLGKAENLISQRKESIRLLDEYLKSMFLEMFGDTSKNRNKFQKGTIRDVITAVKYGTSSPAEDEGLYPYLRMNNITPDGYMDYSKLKYINIYDEREKEKYVVRKGDLLFNRTNSKELVGKTGVFNEDYEMIIAGYLIRVRTNEKANPWFLWGYLNSIHGKQTLLGMCKSIVGMANINAQELQGIKIVIPPIELQTQFAQIVEKTEALKTQYQQSLEELEYLYGSLSQRAFRGEITNKYFMM